MGKKKADACAKDYDLWAEANRTNQSTKPNYVPSLLPSVKVADAGASYNPDAKEYEVRLYILTDFLCAQSCFI